MLSTPVTDDRRFSFELLPTLPLQVRQGAEALCFVEAKRQILSNARASGQFPSGRLLGRARSLGKRLEAVGTRKRMRASSSGIYALPKALSRLSQTSQRYLHGCESENGLAAIGSESLLSAR